MFRFIQNSPNWKQFKCPSIDKKIKKLWHIHSMEYEGKKKKLPQHATTWMNQKNIK